VKVPPNYYYDDAHLIVDATGTSRAIHEDRRFDKFLHCKEYKAKIKGLDEDYIYIYGRWFGYAWLFPLGDDVWHFGAGGYSKEQAEYLMFCLRETLGFNVERPDCHCFTKIRYVRPGTLPLTNWITYTSSVPSTTYGNVLKSIPVVCIGESGGFVSGFGEGNVLAMETAKMLYDCLEWNYWMTDMALNCYRWTSLKNTEWVQKQHDFVESLQHGFWKAFRKALEVKKIANWRSGKLSFWQALKLLWIMTRW